ncbi:MAG TPA: hypothetical protein VJH68_02285 [Candidatus Nanoarchaeia archaeon]|nr:hypothetical protein [Candidatus Nanoarchaeia archaeon]
MRLFRARRRLPHLPLDEPLPSVIRKTSKVKPWTKQSIQQQFLARELENINQAIISLRQQHQELRRRISRISLVQRTDAGGAKPHSPTIINQPEKYSFYDEELSGIQRELSNLKTAVIGRGFKISDIPPLPPAHLTVAERAIISNKLRKPGSSRERFRELAGQLSEASAAVIEAKPEPKKLLDKLRYGIIELQQKWAEVQQRLQAVEERSPEVSGQLQRLEQELSRLEKTVWQSPYIITALPMHHGRSSELPFQMRKKARREIAGKLAQIDRDQQTQHKFDTLLQELSRQYALPHGKYIRELGMYRGTAKPWPAVSSRIQQLHLQLAKKIKYSTAFSRKTAEVKEIEQRISQSYQPPQAKYLNLIPALPRYAAQPSYQARKRVKKEVKQMMAAIERSLPGSALEKIAQQLTQQLSEVKKYQPAKAKVVSEPYQQQPLPLLSSEKINYLVQELEKTTEQEKIKLRRKLAAPIKLTPELVAINETINGLQKAEKQKAKVFRAWPTAKSYDQLRLKKELLETQGLLARAIMNPSLLLEKFKPKKASRQQSLLEQKARQETLAIKARIDSQIEKNNTELLHIEEDLLTLEKMPLKKGKMISKMVTLPLLSRMEYDSFQREIMVMERKLAGENGRRLMDEKFLSAEKSQELLAVERKLAELQME